MIVESSIDDSLIRHSKVGNFGLPMITEEDPLPVPYRFLADDASALSEHIMKPFPPKGLHQKDGFSTTASAGQDGA